jgi:hypothetical protein
MIGARGDEGELSEEERTWCEYVDGLLTPEAAMAFEVSHPGARDQRRDTNGIRLLIKLYAEGRRSGCEFDISPGP